MSCNCSTFRGKRMDTRTMRMIVAAEAEDSGPLTLTQGCCNKGGVAASAGTHDCEGVVDFSVRGLTQTQINRRVFCLRKVGFAAWHRTAIPGVWGAHIHAVAVGCVNLPGIAARQVTALRNGRDGLRSNRVDPHHGMGLPVITYEKYLSNKKVSSSTTVKTLDISATIDAAKKGNYGGTLGTLMKLEGVPATKEGYSRVQKNMGFTGADADGIPGKTSLTRLANEHGYRVVA